MEARWRDGDQRHGESCKHGPAILILSNVIRARDLEASLEAQMTERRVRMTKNATGCPKLQRVESRAHFRLQVVHVWECVIVFTSGSAIPLSHTPSVIYFILL